MIEGKNLDAGKLRLYYEVVRPNLSGGVMQTSEPVMLVYLHGYGTNHTALGHQKAHFHSLGAGSIALDQRGDGKSTRSANKADYSLDAFTRDLEQVIRSEGAKRVTLVGHSSGAIVAQDYAAKHPENVDALVLIAASYDLRKTFVRNAVRNALISLSPLERLAETSYNRICGLFAGDRSEDYPDFTDDKFRKISDLGFAIGMAGRKDPAHLKATHALGQAVMEWSAEGSAPKIDAPTLLVHGSSDWLVPPKTAYELQEMIPGAKGISPVIIPNARHGVHFQQPEQVNAAMEKFLVGEIYYGRLGINFKSAAIHL